MTEKIIDMRDVAIINSFRFHDIKKEILNVGCGKGRIDFYLSSIGYRVYATDRIKYNAWKDEENLTFHISDIFDTSSFPISSAPIVICSQVLEHLKDYKKAMANLLKLTDIKLIITIPYRKSFHSNPKFDTHSKHHNFWDDCESNEFKNVNEFVDMNKPYLVSISKIITKKKDITTRQYNYLIIMDRRQRDVK